MKAFEWGLVVLIIFMAGFLAGSFAFKYHGARVTRIAPTYALDNECSNYPNYCLRPFDSKPFFNIQNKNDFWQEATKNTEFTVSGQPVEITDIQVFYKQDDCKNLTLNCCCPTTCGIAYGNITYYPLGIENSQTYVAPTPTPTSTPALTFPYEFCADGCLICTDHLGNCTYIPGRPTPTPTPCITIQDILDSIHDYQDCERK